MSENEKQLVAMAAEVFETIEIDTGMVLPRATLRDCFDSFQKISAQKGIVWLIDKSKVVSHLAFIGWMAEAREILGEPTTLTSAVQAERKTE